MKHLIILLACLSATPLWAQRSIKIEAQPRCPIYFYNRTDTSEIQITRSFVKARSIKKLIIKYQCDEEAARIYAGATLYLVIGDMNGQTLTNNLPALTLNERSVAPYAQGIYTLEDGIEFAMESPNGGWKKGETFIFRICTKDGEIAKKIILTN